MLAKVICPWMYFPPFWFLLAVFYKAHIICLWTSDGDDGSCAWGAGRQIEAQFGTFRQSTGLAGDTGELFWVQNVGEMQTGDDHGILESGFKDFLIFNFQVGWNHHLVLYVLSISSAGLKSIVLLYLWSPNLVGCIYVLWIMPFSHGIHAITLIWGYNIFTLYTHFVQHMYGFWLALEGC